MLFCISPYRIFYMTDPLITSIITRFILQSYPDVLSIYLFGSFGTAFETKESDVDIALLLPEKADSVALWEVSQKIAVEINRDVDLVDLRAASTVFQNQILSTGVRIYCKDEKQCDLFEHTCLSMYLRFNEERKVDGPVLNKIETIKQCCKRIEEEFLGFENNFTKQDSILLNLQRACEASIDLGMRVVKVKQLGLPQSSRDAFIFLEQAKLISKDLSQRMQSMVGFRNIAVHNYQQINLEIVRSIIEKRLGDFKEFTETVVSIMEL